MINDLLAESPKYRKGELVMFPFMSKRETQYSVCSGTVVATFYKGIVDGERTYRYDVAVGEQILPVMEKDASKDGTYIQSVCDELNKKQSKRSNIFSR